MSENTNTPVPHRVTVEVGGRPLILETGKIAKQANGAIVARYGDTVVLTTACMAPIANDRDFLPLTVDYRENTYSAGKIPGGFFKREGRPSEKEILTSRLIDRPLRPLFPEAWRNETQIVSRLLCFRLAVRETHCLCPCRLARRAARCQPHRRPAKEEPAEHHHRRHGRSHRHGGIRRAGGFRGNGCRCSRIRPRANQKNRRGYSGASRPAQAQESGRRAAALRRRHLQGSAKEIRRTAARCAQYPKASKEGKLSPGRCPEGGNPRHHSRGASEGDGREAHAYQARL